MHRSAAAISCPSPGVDDPHDADLRADDQRPVGPEGQRRGEAILAGVGGARRARGAGRRAAGRRARWAAGPVLPRSRAPRRAAPPGRPGGAPRRPVRGHVHRRELRQPLATGGVVDQDATVVVAGDRDVPAVRADGDGAGREGQPDVGNPSCPAGDVEDAERRLLAGSGCVAQLTSATVDSSWLTAIMARDGCPLGAGNARRDRPAVEVDVADDAVGADTRAAGCRRRAGDPTRAAARGRRRRRPSGSRGSRASAVKTPSSALRVRASGRSRCASTASSAARSRWVDRRATLWAASESTRASRAVREASRPRWTASDAGQQGQHQAESGRRDGQPEPPVGRHPVPRPGLGRLLLGAGPGGGGVQEGVLDRRERRRAAAPARPGRRSRRGAAVELAVRAAAGVPVLGRDAEVSQDQQARRVLVQPGTQPRPGPDHRLVGDRHRAVVGRYQPAADQEVDHAFAGRRPARRPRGGAAPQPGRRPARVRRAAATGRAPSPAGPAAATPTSARPTGRPRRGCRRSRGSRRRSARRPRDAPRSRRARGTAAAARRARPRSRAPGARRDLARSAGRPARLVPRWPARRASARHGCHEVQPALDHPGHPGGGGQAADLVGAYDGDDAGARRGQRDQPGRGRRLTVGGGMAGREQLLELVDDQDPGGAGGREGRDQRRGGIAARRQHGDGVAGRDEGGDQPRAHHRGLAAPGGAGDDEQRRVAQRAQAARAPPRRDRRTTRRRPGRRRAGPSTGTVRCSVTAAGCGRCSRGACCRIACSSSVRSRPGSRPSSSCSVRRARRTVSRASDCRPAR